jgi:hypothetical protein
MQSLPRRSDVPPYAKRLRQQNDVSFGATTGATTASRAMKWRRSIFGLSAARVKVPL